MLKSKGKFLLVAVADSEEAILKHWFKLEGELVPLAREINDRDTEAEFFEAKSASI